MKGQYTVKAQHPWMSEPERYVFKHGATGQTKAEMAAKALIQERTEKGWNCTLSYTMTASDVTYPAKVKADPQPVPDVHAGEQEYLRQSGVPYLPQYVEYLSTGLSIAEIARRDNIQHYDLGAAFKKVANRLRERRQRILWEEYNTTENRTKHRERSIEQIKAALEQGHCDHIDLFFTVIDPTLVAEIRKSYFFKVEHVDKIIKWMKETKQFWRENDLDYLLYVKDRIDHKDWENAFWIFTDPMRNLDTDPTFVKPYFD